MNKLNKMELIELNILNQKYKNGNLLKMDLIRFYELEKRLKNE